jgi:hypothetical protein
MFAETLMQINRWLTLATAVLITLLEVLLFAAAGSRANAASPAGCDMRLNVELTPDVPNPRDAGFLSSLLNKHQGSYRLIVERQGNGPVIVLDLTGTGPESGCRNVVETMRRDARVLFVDVQREPS